MGEDLWEALLLDIFSTRIQKLFVSTPRIAPTEGTTIGVKFSIRQQGVVIKQGEKKQ